MIPAWPTVKPYVCLRNGEWVTTYNGGKMFAKTFKQAMDNARWCLRANRNEYIAHGGERRWRKILAEAIHLAEMRGERIRRRT